MNYSTAINVFLTTTETLQALEKGFLPNAASRGLIQLITSQELFEELCVQYINRVKPNEHTQGCFCSHKVLANASLITGFHISKDIESFIRKRYENSKCQSGDGEHYIAVMRGDKDYL